MKESSENIMHTQEGERAESSDFLAKTVREACALVEAGYEYVTEFKQEGIKIFRKRK